VRGSLSGAFVRKSGDTMTGGLTISTDTAPNLTLNRPDGATFIAMRMSHAGNPRVDLAARPVEPGFTIQQAAVADRFEIDLGTGLLSTALIPLSMLRREELDGENAGLVTLAAAGFTTIVDVTAAANVAVGDRVICWADVTGTKGATSGTVILDLTDQGTANVQWAKDAISAGNTWQVNLNDVRTLSWCTVARVLTAGVLTMRLQGASFGSNFAIAAGAGELRMLILRDGA
jgi:hypothetical protein